MRPSHHPEGVRCLVRLAAGPMVILASLLAVACGDNTVLPTGTGTPGAGGTTAPATSDPRSLEASTIEFDGDSFEPENLDVPRGTPVSIHNASGETLTIVVQGRDEAASGEELVVEPDASVQLRVDLPGAYIVTSADDPQKTASIFIS